MVTPPIDYLRDLVGNDNQIPYLTWSNYDNKVRTTNLHIAKLNLSNNQWEELPQIPGTIENQWIKSPNIVTTAACHHGSLLCLDTVLVSPKTDFIRMYVEYNPATNKWNTVKTPIIERGEGDVFPALAADSGENIYYIIKNKMVHDFNYLTTDLTLYGFSNKDAFTQATVNNAGDLYLIVKKGIYNTDPYIIVKPDKHW